MPYVNAVVLVLPKNNLDAYRRMARRMGKLWMEHGALEYRESVAEDLGDDEPSAFVRLLKIKSGETMMFAWTVFRSRAHRDRVQKRVMNDPRTAEAHPREMPFDPRRMAFGGFQTIIDLREG